MSELPYMPVIVAEEHAETAELTNEELGALTRIKWALWRAGGFLDLADDPNRLVKIARAGSRWGKIAAAVLGKLTFEGNKVSSPSLLKILCITHERRAKSTKAGNARWGKAEPALTSPNLLKTNKADTALASFEHMLGRCNQNQNQEKELSSLETFPAAALEGLPMGQSHPPSTTSTRETLREEGTRLLVERTSLNRLQAEGKIAGWLIALDSGIFGPDILAKFLADVDEFKFTGDAFVEGVENRVKAYADERRNGAALKFGPERIGTRRAR